MADRLRVFLHIGAPKTATTFVQSGPAARDLARIRKSRFTCGFEAAPSGDVGVCPPGPCGLDIEASLVERTFHEALPTGG